MNMALQNNSKVPPTTINMQQAFPSQPLNNMAALPPASMATNSMKLDPIVLQNPLLKQQQQLQQQLKSNVGLPNNKLALMQQLSMNMMAGAAGGMMGMPGMPGSAVLAPNGTNNMLAAMENKVPISQMMPPLMNDKSMSLMNNFDEVEQSLASMEQSNQMKPDMDPMNMDLLSDMSTIMAKSAQDQSLMQQLGFDNTMQSGAHDGGNNGFGAMDPNLLINGIGSGAGGPRNSGMLMGMQSMSHMNSQAGAMPSIFDPITTPVSRSIPTIGPSNNQPPALIGSGSGNGETNPIGPSPGGFRPKPIEELLQNHDKKTPPPLNMDKSGGHAANAFNKNMDMKNSLASSWSSLAAASSPQNTPTSNKPKQQQQLDSFQQYKIKVKEKIEKQKMLEQQEQRRSHKEAAEKRQQQEHQQKMKRDEVDATR